MTTAIVVGLFGLVVGSFLNVVIYRLPRMMENTFRSQCEEFIGENASMQQEDSLGLWLPGSHCPHCGHAITALENIPVLSYLFLKGRCSGCGAGISIRYPLVEMLTALCSAIIALHFGISWPMVAALLLTWSLIALTFIDFDRQLLPDAITLPLLWCGLIASLFGFFTDPRSSILGAIAGYLILWSLYQIFKLLTGKEGMGYGDFKLLALLGAWMGWQFLPLVILLSSFVGALVGIAMILIAGRDRNIPIPFGPYLATAGWIALLWGDQITSSYLQFAGI